MPEAPWQPEDEGAESAREFLQQARKHAQTNGAVVLEFFRCPNCKYEQFQAHGFVEVLPCNHCGHRMASVAPRPLQPGEVTGDAMLEAARLVRQCYPEVDAATVEWMDTLTPQVKTVATAAACHGARKALDKLLDVAQKITGGVHGSK